MVPRANGADASVSPKTPATLFELVGQGRHLRRYRFEPALLDALHASLASYLGHLRKANSYQLRTALWTRYAYLRQYLTLDPASGQISRRDQMPRGLTSVRNQYAWRRRAFPGDLLFFQVGRFYEFYAPADDAQAEALGLRPLAPNRRRARYGFPVERARAYARRVLKAGQSLLVVTQTEHVWTGIRERRIQWRLEPLAATAVEANQPTPRPR